MRNFLFVIIFSVIGNCALSQDITISQISSDADALAFVKQENYDKETAPQWHHFYLTDGDEWKSYYNLSKQQSDSVEQNMSAMRWQKADLNMDGKPDLIVSGYIARRPEDWTTATFKLLVFFSDRGNGSIEMNLIDDKLDKYPAYFNIVSPDGDNRQYLQIYRWHTGGNGLANVVPLRSDTLKYNDVLDYFVQRSTYLNPSAVQRIDYRMQENISGAYHVLSLENINDKSFPVNISLVQPGTKSPDSYKARLTKTLWNNIDTLARSIRFSKDSIVYDNDTYANNKLPITLTIQFKDGTKKIIRDYDADASFTLMTIYQVFEEIINNTLDMYRQRQQQIQQMDDDWNW